jgi:hypothetical protein
MKHDLRSPLIGLVALVSLSCGRPAPALPPPACPACPTCERPEAPAVDEARADPADTATAGEVTVPAHLRPSEAQCRQTCVRLMEAEIKQLEGRIKRAEPELVDALREGLSAEAERLTVGCLDTCARRFTTATTACLIRFEDEARVRTCILNAALALDGVER